MSAGRAGDFGINKYIVFDRTDKHTYRRYINALCNWTTFMAISFRSPKNASVLALLGTLYANLFNDATSVSALHLKPVTRRS